MRSSLFIRLAVMVIIVVAALSNAANNPPGFGTYTYDAERGEYPTSRVRV